MFWQLRALLQITLAELITAFSDTSLNLGKRERDKRGKRMGGVKGGRDTKKEAKKSIILIYVP